MKVSILNILLLTTIAGLSIALYVATTKEQPLIRVRSDHDHYSWIFAQNDLESPPPWRSSDEHPPLSVRKAISKTDEIASNLNKATNKLGMANWRLDCLFISPLEGGYMQPREKWIYVAKFSGANDGFHSGPPFRMSMIILMDGTVLPGFGDHAKEVYNEIQKIYPGNAG